MPAARDRGCDPGRSRPDRFGQRMLPDQLLLSEAASPATAKAHVSHVMTKLYARDRAQLVVVAYESGLVRPGE